MPGHTLCSRMVPPGSLSPSKSHCWDGVSPYSMEDLPHPHTECAMLPSRDAPCQSTVQGSGSQIWDVGMSVGAQEQQLVSDTWTWSQESSVIFCCGVRHFVTHQISCKHHLNPTCLDGVWHVIYSPHGCPSFLTLCVQEEGCPPRPIFSAPEKLR